MAPGLPRPGSRRAPAWRCRGPRRSRPAAVPLRRLAEYSFRRDRGDAVGAAGGTVERGFCRLLRLGAHDVRNSKPFLALLLRLDDAEHHHAAAGPDRPAAGVIDRAIPFGGVVDDDEAFGRVTRLEAKSLAGHACPGMCTADMLPHSVVLGESRSGPTPWRRPRFRERASAPANEADDVLRE